MFFAHQLRKKWQKNMMEGAISLCSSYSTQAEKKRRLEIEQCREALSIWGWLKRPLALRWIKAHSGVPPPFLSYFSFVVAFLSGIWETKAVREPRGGSSSPAVNEYETHPPILPSPTPHHTHNICLNNAERNTAPADARLIADQKPFCWQIWQEDDWPLVSL